MSSMYSSPEQIGEMDRVSLDVLGSAPATGAGSPDWVPAADIRENSDATFIDVELPGFTRDEIHVEMDDRVLSIRGEHNRDKDAGLGTFVWRERSYGSFFRSFGLPSTLTAAQITTEYSNGVLRLTLAKQGIQTHPIEIRERRPRPAEFGPALDE